MSAFKRYEAAVDRARLLYRIPAAPSGKRILELYHSSEPLLRDFDWPGTSQTFCRIGQEVEAGSGESPGTVEHAVAQPDFRKPLPFGRASFDLVVVHRTLDELASSNIRQGREFDTQPFFKNVLDVLVPGGLVAGCADNRFSLKSLRSQLERLKNRARQTSSPGQFTLGSLHKALTVAGFADARLFTLLPNGSAPFKLIDTEPAISRAAFRHELQIARQLTSTPGYLLRRLAVELGLYRQLEESIFFWAYKPC